MHPCLCARIPKLTNSYRLPVPLYHEARSSATLSMLREVCECGAPMLVDGRWLGECLVCGRKKEKFVWDRTARHFLKGGVKYPAEMALAKFRKSNRHDAVRLILTVLPVPPIQVRPPNTPIGDACKGQSDLTYRIVSIIRCGESVAQARCGPRICLSHAVDALQEAVTAYFDGEKASGRRSESKYAYASLAPMLKGKRGLIRYVNFACAGIRELCV